MRAALPWVETTSLSFSARHEVSDGDAAARVLDDLEDFRGELEGLFPTTPYGVAVILHPNPSRLGLAAPWLPLAQLFAAPASRRYFAGWFSSEEIHVLTPAALARRASGVEGSREALLLTPRHEYAHLVVGANNDALPPPFGVASFRRYLRGAWLCEGAAAYFSGQMPHLRPAIVRRLREGGRPDFPPAARDATLLGGTVFSLLEEEAGQGAAAGLALADPDVPPRRALEEAFSRPLAAVERDWRDYLDEVRYG